MSARTIESVLAENTTLQEQVTKLTAERDKATADLTAAKADRDTAQASVKALTAERDTAQASVKTLTTERDALKTSAESLTKERDQLKGESRDFAALVAAGIRGAGIVPIKPGAGASGEDKPKSVTEQCREANAAAKKAA